MTEHTVIESMSLIKLIARLDQSTDPNAREAARRLAEARKRPDRRVGAALMPKKRGGVSEWQAEQAADRAEGYRKFAAAEYGTTSLTPGQARRLNRKLERMRDEAHFIEGGGGSLQEQAMRQIRAAGGMVSDRHVLRILNKPKKKL